MDNKQETFDEYLEKLCGYTQGEYKGDLLLIANQVK
jgi:hypothetical protein